MCYTLGVLFSVSPMLKWILTALFTTASHFNLWLGAVRRRERIGGGGGGARGGQEEKESGRRRRRAGGGREEE